MQCLKRRHSSRLIDLVLDDYPDIWEQAIQYLYFIVNTSTLERILEESESKDPDMNIIEQLVQSISEFKSDWDSIRTFKMTEDFSSKFYAEAKIPKTIVPGMAITELITDYILHLLPADKINEIAVKLEPPLSQDSMYRTCRESRDLESKKCRKLLEKVKREYCGDKDKLYLHFDKEGSPVLGLQPPAIKESGSQ